MPDIRVSAELVAGCGLYCGACKRYLVGNCKGCRENSSATWCKVRSCCMEKRITTCAECAEVQDPGTCKKFNNFISRLFGFIFQSNRTACISHIKQLGLDGHAKMMAEMRSPSVKR